MVLKLALPALDKRSVALASARFKAWWNGAEYDEPAALASLAEDAQGGDDDLFAAAETSGDPRIAALERLWGKGRIGPTETVSEAADFERLQLSASGALAVFGPGLWAPVARLSQIHPGDMRVFEWREETQGDLKRGVTGAAFAKRTTVSAIDAETFSAPTEAFDGLVAVDGFTHADNPSRLAMQFARMLKPKSRALIETYCADDASDTAPAFASAFSEPHLRPAASLVTILDESGLRVESDDDVTERHVTAAREGFRQLAQALKDRGALAPMAARELAWETVSWRARFELLGAGRLQRRCFLVSRA